MAAASRALPRDVLDIQIPLDLGIRGVRAVCRRDDITVRLNLYEKDFGNDTAKSVNGHGMSLAVELQGCVVSQHGSLSSTCPRAAEGPRNRMKSKSLHARLTIGNGSVMLCH